MKWTALFLGILLAGCTEPSAPEAEIRALIQRTEQAAEERDHSEVMGAVAETFVSSRAGDRQQLANYLRAWFFRNRNIHLFVRINSIDIIDPVTANADLTVAMAGQPIPEDIALLGLKADLYRIQLQLLKDKHWQVTHAAWERAGM